MFGLSASFARLTVGSVFARAAVRGISGSAGVFEPAEKLAKKSSVGKKKATITAKKAVKKPAKKTKGPTKAELVETFIRPPKAPASAYALFIADISQSLKKPGVSTLVTDIARVASQNWRSLSDAEKQKYQQKHEVLKTEHEKTLHEWWSNADAKLVKLENRRRRRFNKSLVEEGAKGTKYQLLKDPFAPKRPGSAYVIYFKEKLAALGTLSRDDLTSQAKITATQWKSLSDAERAPYLAKYKEELAKYKRAAEMYSH
ncbi:hypothetical protein GGI12_001880 [Dipsacomyces acuminosporus]|nr:hypothetical protein GGI12_001880 [Dipsacomyces acuminosporus]